jgi:hypothetical protein
MDTTDLEIHRLVELIHPETAMSSSPDSLVMNIHEDESASPNLRNSNLLFPTVHHQQTTSVAPGFGGVLTGGMASSSSLELVQNSCSPMGGRAGSSSNASSPDIFIGDRDLYGARGCGSDGGGEPPFSVNDFVETYMDPQEEETRSSTGGGGVGVCSGSREEEEEEYPDEVYTDSEDEDGGSRLAFHEPEIRVRINIGLQ